MGKDIIRKTGQFLASAKVEVTKAGDYDIYPAFSIGAGKISDNFYEIIEYIIENKSVIIDGYEGVFWDKLEKSITKKLKKLGVSFVWQSVESAMLSPEEIEVMIAPYMGERDSIFGKITDKNLIDWFDLEKLNKIRPTKEATINILAGCGAALANWEAPLIYIDLPKNELQFRMRAGSAFNLGSNKQLDNRIAYKRAFFIDWIALNKHKAEILPHITMIIDGQRPDQLLFMTGENLREGLKSMSENFIRVRPWFEPGAWGGQWIKEKIKGINKDVDNLAWSFELMVRENGVMFESDNYRLEVSFDFLMYQNYKEILGIDAERFKYDFPIRFDFLDTIEGGNLSVQCHPTEEYIKKEFGMPFTQDETYYILDCKEGAEVYLGLQDDVEAENFEKVLINSAESGNKIDIFRYVQHHPAKKHDLFLIPNGTIHASGKNNMVLEISSAPYIFTFKMYDWQRLDLDGRPRPLNILHGMKNLNFDRKGAKVGAELLCKPQQVEKNADFILEQLPTHPVQFYDIQRYTLTTEITVETGNKCQVWMLVEGKSVIVETQSGRKQRFNYVETFVIPAAAMSYKISNESDLPAILVKAYIK